MKHTDKNAEPDAGPINFPFQISQPNFAAIIIVIVAAAVAAAAKHFQNVAVEIFTIPAALLRPILEEVGMKSANVNGIFRPLPVTLATR